MASPLLPINLATVRQQFDLPQVIAACEIADKVALSPSPCLRRIKRLEADGVIRGYRDAILDWEAVGFGLTVLLIEIKVARYSLNNASVLHAVLDGKAGSRLLHMVSGTADFLAEVVVQGLKAYEKLLTERLLALPMIADIRFNFFYPPP